MTLFLVGQLWQHTFAQGTLTLSQPTYNCSTGAITFNTNGGDGSPIMYSAAGVTRSDMNSNNGTVEGGLRSDPKPIVITATQNGNSTSYTFDLASFCATPSNRAPVYSGGLTAATYRQGQQFFYYIPTGAFTDPEGQTLIYSATGLPNGVIVDPTTGTVYGTPTATGVSTILLTATDPSGQSVSGQFFIGVNSATGGTGTAFNVTQPTYNCQTGAITFNTTGGDNTPITFTAPGITRSSQTSNSGTVETGLRTDPKPVVITAVQGGNISVFTFDIVSFCTSTTGTSGTGITGTGQTPFNGTLGSTTGVVGQAFSYSLPGTAFTRPTGQTFTYAASGLPTGLSINPTTGAITGTPTATSNSTVIITATSSGTTSGGTSTTGTSTTGTSTTGTSTTGTSTTGTSTTGTSTTGTSTTGTSTTGTSTTGTSGTGTGGTSTTGTTGVQTFTASLGILITTSATSGSSTTSTSGTGTGGTSNTLTAFNGTLGSTTGTVGQSFTYALPTTAFTTPTGQTLTYAATGLPTGLTINRGTGAITGTPSTAGSNTVIITATSSGISSTVTSGTSTTGTSGTGTGGTSTTGTSTTGTSTTGTSTTGTSTTGTSTTGTSTTGTSTTGTSTTGTSSTGTGGTSTTGTTGIQTFTGTLGILINSSVTSGTSTTGTSGTGTSPTFSGTLGSVSGVVGQTFSYTLPTGAFASGGQSLSYNASGVPQGLTVNSGNGSINGTPTQAGNSQVVIFATNPGGQSASALLGIGISSSTSSGTSTTATSGTSTTATSGTSTTATSGTSTTATSGTSTTATSGTSTTGTTGTATTGTAPVFSGSLVSTTGTVGRAFSYTLPTGAFTGATGQTLTYAATGLPAGLSINAATGAISGTPTTAGSSSVVIRASNAGTSSTATSGTSTTSTSGTSTSGTATAGQSASGTLTITISASSASGRIATETLAPIGVQAVGGNPITNGLVEVAVTGAEGETIDVILSDTRGNIVGQQQRSKAGSVERFRFDVSRQPGGTLLFRAATPTRANTIRLLKID
ncbi:MAG: hypothetical protein EAZ91_18320 [Cytophagales bacterium]|nr:MAG: hypothetical protein EAZ91_18320 [Cytophagales bacterium]